MVSAEARCFRALLVFISRSMHLKYSVSNVTWQVERFPNLASAAESFYHHYKDKTGVDWHCRFILKQMNVKRLLTREQQFVHAKSGGKIFPS